MTAKPKSQVRKLSINIERLRTRLSYAPDTGAFVWIRPTRLGMLAGSPAGKTTHHGYRMIMLDGEYWAEHRLAWAYVHGTLPALEIDHINHDRADNRIANLRLATRLENARHRKDRRQGAST